MRVILLIAAFLIASSFAQEGSADSSVVHLSANNFTNAAYGDGIAVVLFFAPWCPHCQSFRPTYEKFAKQAPDGVTVADVDA